MTDVELCVEHVWRLRDLVVGADAVLAQQYGCERCPATLVIGPGDAPLHGPDLPA